MPNTNNPLVLCVMLAAGRREMVKRSIESFKAQTYEERLLYILDNGLEALDIPNLCGIVDTEARGIFIDRLEPAAHPLSIGALRNIANRLSDAGVCDAPLIAHWDSDDWYHPLRLETQIDALNADDAELVGFRSALFYDATKPDGNSAPAAWARGDQSRGEAWIYRSTHPQKCVGSSMLYRRETWQRFQFKDVHTGEDTLWQNNRIRASGLEGFRQVAPAHSASVGGEDLGLAVVPSEPLMIAAIHAANTCGEILEGYREWTRAPQWDLHCRLTMNLQPPLLETPKLVRVAVVGSQRSWRAWVHRNTDSIVTVNRVTLSARGADGRQYFSVDNAHRIIGLEADDLIELCDADAELMKVVRAVVEHTKGARCK